MRKIFTLFFILSVYCTQSQTLRYAIANPYVGLSTYSTKQNDVFSFTSNQAALAQTKNMGVGVYGERRFMLSETSSYSAAFAMPTDLGNFGLQMNYSGFSAFNENKIGLAYARTLGSAVDIGVQFNYYNYRMQQYGNASAINFEAGMMLHVSDQLNAGIYTFNPIGGKIGKNGEEEMAAVYKIGLGYDASDDFFIGAEIGKEEDKPVNVTGGIQYRFKQQFFARVGFRSDNSTVFAGAGLAFSLIRVDVTASYHPQLGFSPGLMLIANFKKKG